MMGCKHDWGWPRRRGGKNGKDVQTCTKCGDERESTIQFERKEPMKCTRNG